MKLAPVLVLVRLAVAVKAFLDACCRLREAKKLMLLMRCCSCLLGLVFLFSRLVFNSMNYLFLFFFWFVFLLAWVYNQSRTSPCWLLLVLTGGLYFEITEYAHFLLYDHVAFARIILVLFLCIGKSGREGGREEGVGECWCSLDEPACPGWYNTTHTHKMLSN